MMGKDRQRKGAVARKKGESRLEGSSPGVEKPAPQLSLASPTTQHWLINHSVRSQEDESGSDLPPAPIRAWLLQQRPFAFGGFKGSLPLLCLLCV